VCLLEYAKLFLQLSIAGATLYVLYQLGIKFFEYLKERNSMDSKKDSKFDKLCDRIDKLVEAFYINNQSLSTLVTNNNSVQVDIKEKLDLHTNILLDLQKKTTLIEERTKELDEYTS
jgi:hypothetical protein